MYGVEPIADADEQARRRALAHACLDGAYASWRPRRGDPIQGEAPTSSPESPRLGPARAAP